MDRDRRQGRDRRSEEERRQQQRRVQERLGGAERRQGQDRRDDLDRRASPNQASSDLARRQEAARIERAEQSWRALENNHPQWCHAFREHVWASDQQLADRAAGIRNARGQHETFTPSHATRWQSSRAMATAAYRLEQSRDYVRAKAEAERQGVDRFPVRGPLEKVIGPGWRADVYGRSRASQGRQESQWVANSEAIAWWAKQDDGDWHLNTCYPHP